MEKQIDEQIEQLIVESAQKQKPKKQPIARQTILLLILNGLLLTGLIISQAPPLMTFVTQEPAVKIQTVGYSEPTETTRIWFGGGCAHRSRVINAGSSEKNMNKNI